MINKALSKISKTQILISIATSIALIVDSIVISKFLGTSAMAGYGAGSPVLMIIMAVSGVISTGGQILCAERIGKADTEGANRIVGLSVVLSLVFAVVFILIFFFGTELVIWFIGIEQGTELSVSASDYLKGFILGAPAFIGTLTLMPYMQLDGNRKFAIISMAGVTVGDILGDIVVVMIHGGIYGIGVASAVSYYIGVAVLLCHFIFKKGTLRIRINRLPWLQTGKFFTLAVPPRFKRFFEQPLVLRPTGYCLHAAGPVLWLPTR